MGLLAELDDAEASQVSGQFDVSLIRDMLAVAFYHDLMKMCQHGFAQMFLSPVSELQILRGETIGFNTDDGKEGERDESKVLQGVFEGIDEESHLKLRLPDKTLRIMVSGEIVPLQKGLRALPEWFGGPAVVVSLVAIGAGLWAQAEGHPLAGKRGFLELLQILGKVLFVALGGRAAFNLPFTPVPVTAQTLCIQLASLYLGPTRSAIAMATFAALELFGSGPLGLKLGSPRGSPASRGYIIGFIPASFVYGLPARWAATDVTMVNVMLNAALASSLTYLGGVMGLVYFGVANPVRVGVLPFLPGDFVKSFFAAMLFTHSVSM